MPAKSKRNLFAIRNPYQMQSVLLLISPLFVMAATLTAISYIVGSEVDRLLTLQSYGMVAGCIAKWFYLTVCFIFITLITFFLMAFKFSENMLNPFTRILKEMDEVLETGKKKVITVRPEDDLANEVLLRVNKFIQKMP